MATIHPSRAGFVPSDSPPAEHDRERELRQKLEQTRSARTVGSGQARHGNEARRSSPPYGTGRHERIPPPREYERDVGPDNYSYHQRGWGSDRRFNDRDPPPHVRQYTDESGVPPPGAWGRRGSGSRQVAGMASGGFINSRQEQRNASSISIWPPSPTSPYKSEEEGREGNKRSSRHKRSSNKHSSRHHHRSRRHSSEELSEADEEHERRRRRRRERRDRSVERSKRHRSASPRRSGNDSEEDEKRRRRWREKEVDRDAERGHGDDRHRRHHRSSRHRHRRSPDSDIDDGMREEQHRSRGTDSSAALVKQKDVATSISPMEARQGSHGASPAPAGPSSSGKRIGPQLPPKPEADASSSNQVDPRAYGKALLPGEGSAMANYVQDGQRIPRRGEIGLDSEQIEAYEKAGFVMSGSRHNRMNAVRMRKENQIYTAEENRSILKMIAEEKQKKEAALIEQFKEMVDSIDH